MFKKRVFKLFNHVIKTSFPFQAERCICHTLWKGPTRESLLVPKHQNFKIYYINNNNMLTFGFRGKLSLNIQQISAFHVNIILSGRKTYFTVQDYIVFTIASCGNSINISTYTYLD